MTWRFFLIVFVVPLLPFWALHQCEFMEGIPVIASNLIYCVLQSFGALIESFLPKKTKL